ncbi:aldehyde dehydrogenase [Plectosphaerella cucumerina]|uniref:aldehyde dehydrogenase (NAD(+)) n=1 Tax=Plectosphaerella cucumerina TaxID=40658 RepID=A0A8K0T8S0_9PEZI|nr:aldehyde dehydrogenase [Plectosphaerella cucumerina]
MQAAMSRHIMSRPAGLLCLTSRTAPPSQISLSRAYEISRRNLSFSRRLQTEITLRALNGLEWKQPTGLFINNQFVESSNGQKMTTIDPFTEQEICSVSAATEEDVNTAVSSARSALTESWTLDPSLRSRLLHRLADLVDANLHRLATIETLDNGKPYHAGSLLDVPEVATTLRYYAGWADKLHGHSILCGPDKLAYTLREPLGVCAQIIPWNYPLLMAAWKLGPALAAGNTVVLKPAEQTPLSILSLAELVREAGFPRGVVNILNGHGREAGAALARHPDVDKVAFTGSTATGREIMRLAAGTLKNITLETGGKSPLIVFSDADLDQAVHWAHEGIMANQGQVCTATSRLLVHESIHDAFLSKFTAAVQKISVLGSPWDEKTYQGPQVTRSQLTTILSLVQSARDEGATVALGGVPASPSGRGFFVSPTVLTDVTSDMRVFREEIFGPCVSVTRFSSEDEAVRLANDSSYGLGAAVFTRDLARAHRVARRVQAGMVWVNSSNDSDVRVPFGGVKQSGIGRELGEAGIEAYTAVKAVHINLSGA